MRFSNTLFTLALSLPLAYADNLITFIPQDDQARIIYFTSNPGCAIIPDLYAPAGKTVSVTLPHGWEGNFKAPHAGADKNANWILGEVAFQGGDDHKLNSYDVSAIAFTGCILRAETDLRVDAIHSLATLPMLARTMYRHERLMKRH
ncbi:DNase1 protein [Rutstroemia sp. NJR-2017a WRK4]|nr:DNase1 protein [Rutstroemia sp. NJR-2017a WRK4]